MTAEEVALMKHYMRAPPLRLDGPSPTLTLNLTLTLTLTLTYLKAAPFIYYGTYVAFFGKMVLVLAERGLPGANV